MIGMWPWYMLPQGHHRLYFPFHKAHLLHSILKATFFCLNTICRDVLLPLSAAAPVGHFIHTCSQVAFEQRMLFLLKRAPADIYPNENLKAEIIGSPMSLLSKAPLAP